MTRIARALLLFLALVPAGSTAAEPLIVFAAASLRGALDQIAEMTDAEVSLAYGGSGTMARQVAAGAPADAVILASPDWMNWLVASGAPLAGPPRPVLGNTLVVIGPAGSAALSGPEQIPGRLGTGRLAMGHHDAVPAGVYARQWLSASGLWEAVAPRLAETDNVRAALAYVARGATPLGIVYGSDALASDAVDVVWEVAPERHDPILYMAAALSAGGQDFLDTLSGPEVAAIFRAHGFAPVRE